MAQKRDYIIIRESYARFFHGGRHSARTAAYLKICALLVPKEMKLEHTNSVSSLSDEELDQAIAAIKAAARCKTKDRQQRPGLFDDDEVRQSVVHAPGLEADCLPGRNRAHARRRCG